MRKNKIKIFKPVIFNNFNEACECEIDNFSVFPIIQDKNIIGYRIWLEEDKNYLRDIISKELYWEGYNSEDFNLIKRKYDWPYRIVEDICYGISLIENYIEEILL